MFAIHTRKILRGAAAAVDDVCHIWFMVGVGSRVCFSALGLGFLISHG